MNSQEMSVSNHKFRNWPAVRYLVMALALVSCLAGAAIAQTAMGVRPANAKSSKKSDPPSSSATDQAGPGEQTPPQASGMEIGNYNVQGSVNLGWRYSNISGSHANYDTFINLQQGPRLLDFGFNSYSLNHDGSVYDSLSLTGFGFGGDPDDVVRLRMSKNKWYNFDADFRRDKYFFDYNLFANPFNPAGGLPSFTINYSPHALDLSRRMTDLNLTLKPESRIRYRLGYSHESLGGPSLSSDHVGTEAQLYQNWRNTTDVYHGGVDFLLLPRTMLSYDQYIEHFKQDTSFTDMPGLPTLFGQNNNFGYQVFTSGAPVPVDLGFTPITCSVSTTTSPPTASPTCAAYESYFRKGIPRVLFPTERFSFQSTYFPNLTMTGQVSYSSGDNTMPNYVELFSGYEPRTASLGTATIGKGNAQDILVNGDWAAVYQVTSKLRILESFDYNRYNLPGTYNFNVGDVFSQGILQNGRVVAAGMALPPAKFNSTNCPPPYTALTCPQHNSSSAADLSVGYDYRFLGQRLIANTFQLGYDFTPKVGARIGYRYVNRKIHDANGTFYAAETFLPGGAVGANRGDCQFAGTGPVPNSFPVLEDDTQRGTCTVQADGTRVYTGFAAGSDTEHGLMADINGNSALFGLWVRPASNFRSSFDVELFSADQSFTRITPRLLRHYQINSTYTPVSWTEITGAIDIINSSDDVTEVQDKEHNRGYSLTTTFMPGSRFSFDLSYNYSDIYTQAFDCFAASGSTSGLPVGFSPTATFGGTTVTVPTCPLVDPDGNPSPVTIGALAKYQSKSNFASADMMVQPLKQVTFTLGYAGSFVRGTTAYTNPATLLTANFLDGLTPWGPLRFNYQTPYVTLNWNLYKGLSYLASWNYYGYNSRGNNNPAGLTPLGTQDFNGNNMTLSARYAF